MSLRSVLLGLSWIAVLAFTAGGDETKILPAPNSPFAESGEWTLETLRTRSGRAYRGYVQSADQNSIEFIEVVRPAGGEMYFVVRTLPASEVASLERLPLDQRQRLADQIARRIARLRIEAGEMKNVQLVEQIEEGRRLHVYQGPWFRLSSDNDDGITRRAVVRIEQIFRAYRHALPPRVEPHGQLNIILYGSMEQYREYLRKNRLEINHPAFYSPAANRIVAGADLAHYAERLKQIRADNDRVRAKYAALHREFPQRQRELAERLRQNGFTSDEVREELRARSAAWENQFQATMRKLAEIDRRNEARFEEVSQQLFARLRHEAFHAYVENYLYPARAYAFPRWLNEGLAQVFETARLDGETLRLDAPDRDRLQRLQADLRGNPLPLAELLTAADDVFLATHAQADVSQRHYLYSWGLAWWLLLRGQGMSGHALEQYAAPEMASHPPIARFEQFVGMGLQEFEPQWRTAMLQLGPVAR